MTNKDFYHGEPVTTVPPPFDKSYATTPLIDPKDVDHIRATYASPRHPKSERFHQILKELGELHDRKQQDYGQANDPFANITSSREWGIPPHVGSLLRMNDKVTRLKAWVTNGHLANEGAEDSIRDIAVYAIIALVQLEFELKK